MIKFAVLAVAVSALTSVPAAAADMTVGGAANPAVRIAFASKTPASLDAEIRAAARAVCKVNPDTAKEGCVNAAVRDAKRQLAAAGMTDDSSPLRLVASNEGLAIRVSLAGKSPNQIATDLDTAARTVCKATVGQSKGKEFGDCFSASAHDARAQLAQIVPARQLAAN